MGHMYFRTLCAFSNISKFFLFSLYGMNECASIIWLFNVDMQIIKSPPTMVENYIILVLFNVVTINF